MHVRVNVGEGARAGGMSHWAPARIRIQGKDETRAWTHYPNPLLMLDSCRVTVLAAGLVVLLTHPPPWFMDDWFMGDWFMDDWSWMTGSWMTGHG